MTNTTTPAESASIAATPPISNSRITVPDRTAAGVRGGAESSRRTTTVVRSEPPRHSSPLLAELDREWARMHRRPQVLRHVRAWADHPVLGPVVTDIADLDDLVHATQPGVLGGGIGDEVLRQLITLAGTEELAGRIVLQRILPGLISRSRRWDGHTRGADVCDIAIGAAWLAIRTYDVEARSLHVAPRVDRRRALDRPSAWLATQGRTGDPGAGKRADGTPGTAA